LRHGITIENSTVASGVVATSLLEKLSTCM
jgi:hypothetical protein